LPLGTLAIQIHHPPEEGLDLLSVGERLALDAQEREHLPVRIPPYVLLVFQRGRHNTPRTSLFYFSKDLSLGARAIVGDPHEKVWVKVEGDAHALASISLPEDGDLVFAHVPFLVVHVSGLPGEGLEEHLARFELKSSEIFM